MNNAYLIAGATDGAADQLWRQNSGFVQAGDRLLSSTDYNFQADAPGFPAVKSGQLAG